VFVRHAITVLSLHQTEIAQITFFRTAGAFTGFDLPERIAPHSPRATGPVC
jgi:hypothetical protein